MTDQILIRDLLVRGSIGIEESERAQSQDILVNLVLYTDAHAAEKSDSISDCVDYSKTTKQIITLVEKNTRKTVEALAGDIVQLCLQNPLVSVVRVRVEKPNRVRFTRAVGVEIERSR